MTNSIKNNNNANLYTAIRTYEKENMIAHKHRTLSPEQYKLFLKLESLKVAIEKTSTICETRKDYEKLIKSYNKYPLVEPLTKRNLNQRQTQRELWKTQVECTSLKYYIMQKRCLAPLQ